MQEIPPCFCCIAAVTAAGRLPPPSLKVQAGNRLLPLEQLIQPAALFLMEEAAKFKWDEPLWQVANLTPPTRRQFCTESLCVDVVRAIL